MLSCYLVTIYKKQARLLINSRSHLAKSTRRRSAPSQLVQKLVRAGSSFFFLCALNAASFFSLFAIEGAIINTKPNPTSH
jgi:hypothetical protein